MPTALHTQSLTKRYRGRLAVDSLDLEVPTGVVAGFIGPNGAGKTTTMAMLSGCCPDGRERDNPRQKPRPAASYLARVSANRDASILARLTGGSLRSLATLGGHGLRPLQRCRLVRQHQ
jgi:ABC-2 type transport system ATP-binding protein